MQPTALIQLTHPDGSQYCEMLKPLPLESDGEYVMKKRIVGVHENGEHTARYYLAHHAPAKGIVVDTESTLCNGNEIYARMFVSLS